MIWLLIILIILLIGGVAVVAAGYGRALQPVQHGNRPLGLPAGKLSASNLEAVRFNTAVRGYRMDEVDELIDRLVRQLAAVERAAPDRPERG